MATKPSLQVALGQQLRLTPQLRQAIHLLQLSGAELERELAVAVESNPLLDWEEAPVEPPADADAGDQAVHGAPESTDRRDDREPDWTVGGTHAATAPDDPGEDVAAGEETLHDHLLWQLHLGPLSARDRAIGVALVDAIDDDGYLREPPVAAAAAAGLEPPPSADEVSAMLCRIQSFDPPGIGAPSLGECLRLQLALLPDDTPGRALAAGIAGEPLQRLPRIGIEGLAAELQCDPGEVATAVALLRSLDPRPGARFGTLPAGTYVTPDVVVWRDRGVWRAALAEGTRQRVGLHREYAALAGQAGGADASYLRGKLQEARWLLKGLQSRGETLLRVTECLLREQAGFLEFGDQALRPLTLREVAAAVGLHESTVSRAVARKYARTPRGTLPLRAFFASGIDTAAGEASSTAVQAMIRGLVDAEDPRRPLSDARLADALRDAGVPVARRTVAKYREALRIPPSTERLRMA